jgi:hypothetical protein
MKRLLLFKAIALSLAAGFLAFGQGLTNLSGVVVDPTGAVIPSAELKLVNLATQPQRQAKSDAEGRYLFAQVQPGTYRIQGKAAGSATSL